MTEWNDTPAESPEAKWARLHPTRALHILLKQMCHRLKIVDRAQVYIIDQLENAPESLSLVKVERAELEHKTQYLLSQWFESCGLRDRAPSKDDEDRPSSSNIVVNIENMQPAVRSLRNTPSIFTTAKFRRVVILIAAIVAGSIIGSLWVLKLIHDHNLPVPTRIP